MDLTIIGSGDAFGSGGRLQTCFHVTTGESTFLIDCGATSLIGMAREALDPAAIDVIFISHLHGDHFSGLVWWVLHSQHVLRRERPLTVVGPTGIEARYRATADALFPGSGDKPLRFELQFEEHRLDRPVNFQDVSCSCIEVSHPSGAPSLGLRFEAGGKVLSFSGDTEWVDGLIALAKGADLHINECFSFDDPVPHHTSWKVLQDKIALLGARQVLLTHMGVDMLARAGEIDDPRVALSRDGLRISI
ncbi:MAG: MBL fold metallo-hydrolase [Alphaproteobacteria bacterium]|nr:MBL fold metallo-hydrolase [Alphaproteobacteria bacterium]